MLALIPQVAAWGKLQIDNALGAAGTNAAAVGLDRLAGSGVLYHGLEILGGGAILTSLILAAVTACIIDRTYGRAAGFALAGSGLTFFGFMHSEAIGLAQSPTVAVAYLAVAGVLYGCARLAMPVASQSSLLPDHGLEQPAV